MALGTQYDWVFYKVNTMVAGGSVPAIVRSGFFSEFFL
jgi:hypothetical protein